MRQNDGKQPAAAENSQPTLPSSGRLLADERGGVLLVCYGSGHVRMLIPVAHALRARGTRVRVLGLTTAAQAVRDAGLPLLQIKDFVREGDEAALAQGEWLSGQLENVIDRDETVAYLGLSYADLVFEVGEAQARRRYEALGRQAFLPLPTLLRVLGQTQPQTLVITNAPRAERAAALAARQLNIPCLCLIDLFAIDEVMWIGQLGYADRLCVLNESVRSFLRQAGRRADEIVVTGNPAFDLLCSPETVATGKRMRIEQGWGECLVLLWPLQVEPECHPWSGKPGDPTLPARVLEELLQWVLSHENTILCVRPRAGEPAPALPSHPRILVTGQEWPLPQLLNACDVVVTLTSTVGLEGRISGTRVVQVTGSVFGHAMPLLAYGLADAAVSVEQLASVLDSMRCKPLHRLPQSHEPAAERVADEVTALLQSGSPADRRRRHS